MWNPAQSLLPKAEFANWLPVGEICSSNMVCVDCKMSFRNWTINLKLRYYTWKTQIWRAGKGLLIKHWEILCISSWKKSPGVESWLLPWHECKERGPAPLHHLCNVQVRVPACWPHTCTSPAWSLRQLQLDKTVNVRQTFNRRLFFPPKEKTTFHTTKIFLKKNRIGF